MPERGRPAIGDRLPVALPEPLRARIQAYALREGIKLAEAVRRLAESALDAEAQTDIWKLTPIERARLLNALPTPKAVAAELRRAGVVGAPGLAHHTAVARYVEGKGWPKYGRVHPGSVDGGGVVVIPLPHDEGHERIEYSPVLAEFSRRYASGEWPELLWEDEDDDLMDDQAQATAYTGGGDR